MKDPARELLRLRLLLERKDQELAQGRLELEKKELEWKMAGLHAKGVDQSGENTILGGNFSAMETSQLNKYVFILIFSLLIHFSAGSQKSSFPRHQVQAVVEVVVEVINSRRKTKEMYHLPHQSEICEVTCERTGHQ